MVRSIIAAIFIATSASAAELPPATPLVTGPGDQTDPSLGIDFVAYLGSTARGTEIFVQSVLPGSTPIQQTFDDVDQGPPHLVGMRYAFRSPGVVEVRDLTGSPPFSILTGDGTFLGRTALSSTLVAWEEAGTDTGIDVGWQRFGDPLPPRTVLRDPGDQHSISVTGDWIAYVDGGSVKLVNTAADVVRSFDVPGTAEDVSIWARSVGAPLLAVLALPEGGDGTSKTIHVLDSSNGTLVASLATPGLKIHPRLFGEWVGFEASDDQLKPQVTLWHFTDASGPPWLFLPSPTGSYQKLHDLVVSSDTVRVVWSDDSSGDFDIYMFEAPVRDVLAPRTVVGPASCDSSATPIGQFTVTRAKAGPSVGGTLFTANVATPVLLCIASQGVTSGWIGVGSQVVAAPGDFGQGSLRREVRLTVGAGEGRAGAALEGGPGAELRVRIFADGGNGNVASDLETCAGSGDCPPAPSGLAKRGGLGCSTASGYASLASFLLPAALLLAPRRRRSRR